jgi:hypothetical protein
MMPTRRDYLFPTAAFAILASSERAPPMSVADG